MEEITSVEKSELTEKILQNIDEVMESDPEVYTEIKGAIQENIDAGKDPYYGVPWWLIRWLIKHLPKK